MEGRAKNFFIVSEKDIKSGKTTDVYHKKTVEILQKAKCSKQVRAEVRASSLPENYSWAVLSGIEEVICLFSNLKANIQILPEGTIFKEEIPVLEIVGEYTEFAMLETAILGLLCQSSGIATKAARCRIAAGNKTILSLGARRMHPTIAPMIDRSAFIGGCDGVSTIKSAEMLQEKPQGTMPHSLILMMGSPEEAFRLFHETEPPTIKRIVQIDTIGDEKFEAIKAEQTLGNDLFAVWLDTPNSRRGDFKRIIEEVRWELNLRDFNNVKIFASGGLDEYSIQRLSSVVDGYGVGTALSNAPVINFSMDIVEIEGIPVAKRGKMSGSKAVYRCTNCYQMKVVSRKNDLLPSCSCNGRLQQLFLPIMSDGRLERQLPSPQDIRTYVLRQLENMKLKL
ncbi:MAG: nicotinate phosphoribosyltransferase [bacterium]